MLYQQIKDSSLSAQKSGDGRLLAVLKLVLSELSYAMVDNKGGELPDEIVLKVLAKEAKKRKEAIEIFEKAGEGERVKNEQYELSVIESYLPKQMAESELVAIVETLHQETSLTGGRLVGAVMSRVSGQTDGNTVSRIVMAKYP